MLRGVLDFIRRVFMLWKRLDKAEEELAHLREERDRLVRLNERIFFELQRDRENAAHEREKLLLQLENALLKFERRLPPEKSAKGK